MFHQRLEGDNHLEDPTNLEKEKKEREREKEREGKRKRIEERKRERKRGKNTKNIFWVRILSANSQ